MLILLAGLVWAPCPQAQAAPKPEFVKFDAPGAGTGAGQGTFFDEINQIGIVGWYVDANNVNHAYLCTFDGTITIV
jgi:hypothetical protein